MKLLSAYCNSLSINPPEKPVALPTQFYPIPDKYLTIQNSSGQPGKDYSLWQNVIDIIVPYLSKEDIKIIQIGQGDVKPLNKVISLVNQTKFAQTVYILNNSLLHVGNDSFAAHSTTESPILILFGSTSEECHFPYYTHVKSKAISSHRFGRKPSYQAHEPGFKTIDLIDPFHVAAEILSILEIKHNITEKTVLVGDAYSQGSFIEIIPDFVMPADAVAPGVLNLRGDLFYVPDLIIQNIQQRAYVLHLNRELDINILKQLKPNIPSIVFEIDENTNVEYLKQIVRTGINLQLRTRISEEAHNTLKLDYLDLPLVVRQENTPAESVKNQIKSYNNVKTDEDLEIFLQKSIYNESKQVKYYSRKHVLSQNRIYNGVNQWRKQINVENVEQVSVADFNDQEWLNESAHFITFVE